MRIQRENPQADDLTPAELKELHKRRDAQNAKLMRLARGESDAIPIYDYCPLPRTEYKGDPVTAEKWLAAALAECRGSYFDRFARRTRELAAIGVVAGEGEVLTELWPTLAAGAREWMAECDSVVEDHGDLWTLRVFHQLAGLSLLLRERGLRITDMLEAE